MKKFRSKRVPPFQSPTRVLLIVISGPSGAGKDAVLASMKQQGYPASYITTVTTRSPRAGEKDTVDYHFVSTEQFQAMMDNKELLEWAEVYGNWYGVPQQPVKQALGRGRDVIMRVDIQGAATIKNIMSQAVFIFLMPPSIEELILRLKQRHTESAFDLDRRIKTAEEEIKQLPLFDYLVLNRRDEIDLAVSQIKAIITAEKCRIASREITL